MKKQLLLILMTLLPMVALADESGKCGDNITWTYYEATHSLVLTGSGAMKDYHLDWNYNLYVSTAPWHVFHNDIISVTLPEGLTSIGNCAFANCNSLTSVTIPTSVTIYSGAFSDCNSLKAVYISADTVARRDADCSGLG